jgi:hypothetical protein
VKEPQAVCLGISHLPATGDYSILLSVPEDFTEAEVREGLEALFAALDQERPRLLDSPRRYAQAQAAPWN